MCHLPTIIISICAIIGVGAYYLYQLNRKIERQSLIERVESGLHIDQYLKQHAWRRYDEIVSERIIEYVRLLLTDPRDVIRLERLIGQEILIQPATLTELLRKEGEGGIRVDPETSEIDLFALLQTGEKLVFKGYSGPYGKDEKIQLVLIIGKKG